MQIKIEIDVEPEELQRFLGVQGIVGLPDDLINFLREKMGQAGENFDPAAFVRDNLEALRRNRALRRVLYGVKGAAAAATRKSRTRRRSPRDGEGENAGD